MATKDYVRRGRAKKKTTTKKSSAKKKQVATQRRVSIKFILFAVILLSLFCYGLYSLTQSPAPQIEDTPVPVKEVSKPKPSRQESDNLPPKPTEKWSYIEELENKEVTVEAVDKTGSTHRYLMQCGAYKSKDQAEQRKAMIAFQGLNSQVKASTGTKGTWYRIILGPYPQKRKAEQDRHTLQRAKITPCAIWYWEWD